MHLRPATLDDLPLLLHWDRQPHVVASNPDSAWDYEADLRESVPWREQFLAELGGRPIGFLQILDPSRDVHHYWGTEVAADLRAVDIWIGEASDLGQGHGTRMMRLALARCFGQPEVNAVLVDPLAANAAAHRFYQRLGFAPLERRHFGEDDCLVHRLERAVWEQQRAR